MGDNAAVTKILVIEDEASLLEDIIEMLRFAEFDVEGASDGEEGLQKARYWQPDVILCDIMMPGIDGFDVLRNIRDTGETSNMPFIFLTARGDRNSQRHGMALGADDFIVKPFTTNELLTSISARLKRQADMTETSEARLERTKQQLARMVTHELRTPLISINTVVEVISRQVNQLSPSEINELLESVQAANA
jgi:DNA-binding response OmpR family regulator